MSSTIHIQQLSKTYNGVSALKDFNVTLGKGQCFGLLGANGAGKTTAIECILGTKQADTGEVSILGLHPHKHRKKLFQRVGVQFQEPHYQEKILVKELCEETACLYHTTTPYLPLLEAFVLKDKVSVPVAKLSGVQK